MKGRRFGGETPPHRRGSTAKGGRLGRKEAGASARLGRMGKEKAEIAGPHPGGLSHK
jgi:hypothetical protein